jgi:hypothetical protein
LAPAAPAVVHGPALVAERSTRNPLSLVALSAQVIRIRAKGAGAAVTADGAAGRGGSSVVAHATFEKALKLLRRPVPLKLRTL